MDLVETHVWERTDPIFTDSAANLTIFLSYCFVLNSGRLVAWHNWPTKFSTRGGGELRALDGNRLGAESSERRCSKKKEIKWGKTHRHTVCCLILRQSSVSKPNPTSLDGNLAWPNDIWMSPKDKTVVTSPRYDVSWDISKKKTTTELWTWEYVQNSDNFVMKYDNYSKSSRNEIFFLHSLKASYIHGNTLAAVVPQICR